MDSETKKVFNYILNRGGFLKFEELLKQPSPLAKLTEQDAEKWLFSRETNNNFRLERKQDGALVSVKLYFKTRFCVKYQETGSCKKENCDHGWHICKGFVDGNCDNSSKCNLSHDFHDKKNSRKILELGIEKASNSVLRRVIANCLPHICPYFLEKKCRSKRKCQNLHVCPDYVRGSSCDESLICGFESHGHNLQDPHNKDVLFKFELSPYIKPVKNVLINILIGKGISSSKEKQPETTKQFKQEPRLDLNPGEKVNDQKEKNFNLPKGKGQGRHGKKDQENVARSGEINDLNIPIKPWMTVHSCSEAKWPQAGSVNEQEEDQYYLRLQQGRQYNLIRNTPPLEQPPLSSKKFVNQDQRSFHQLRPAFSVDSNLHNPLFGSSSGVDNITSSNNALSQGLELNENQLKERRGRGFSSNRGHSRGRGARHGDNLVNKQEQQKERNLMVEDGKFERGGLISHTGYGRGQRGGRGRARGGETSNQLVNRNKHEQLKERNLMVEDGKFERGGMISHIGRGRGHRGGRGRARGGETSNQLVNRNKHEQLKERNLMVEDGKFERGGMISHIGRGRGHRGGRGRARGGETSNQLVNRNKAESESNRNTYYHSVPNQDDVKMLNSPEEKTMNSDECCSQKQKKKRSRPKQKKSKQKIDNASTKTEDKLESKELIDFSDGSASDEDSSTLLIDFSTDLSQDQHQFELLSQPYSMENWLEDDYTLSQGSSQSLSQFNFPVLDSLEVLQENPTMESNLLSHQSPSNTITNVSLEKAIFDILCKEYNCVAKFSEIAARPHLFLPNVMDIESWFRMHSNSFQLTENERGEVETVSSFSRTARMCFRYIAASSGICNQKKCSYFHVCKEMVATGVCSFGATCTMNHDLQDERNKSIACQLKLNDLSDEQLCALMRASAPQVCLKYNMTGCPKKEKCEKVHICKAFVRRKCSDSEDCDLSHEEALTSTHTQTVLDRLRMPAAKISNSMLVKMLLICENPFNSSAAQQQVPHFYDDPSVYICDRYVLGRCRQGYECPRHHCLMPYQWQYFNTLNGKWESFPEDANEDLERLYCDVTIDELVTSHLRDLPDAVPRLQPGSPIVKINFLKMCAGNDFVHIEIRRLSTESYASSSAPSATRWVWYWQADDKSWKEYGYGEMCGNKELQREIEASYQRRDKVYSFSTAQHQYRLDFQDPMYQQNMNPKLYTTKYVKRRPLFCSGEEVMKNKRDPMKKIKRSKAAVRIGSWRAIPEGQSFIRVPISSGSHEFKDVEHLFYQTITRDRFVVTKIERVQNKELWNSYERKKSDMVTKAESLEMKAEERFLFHSTTQAKVDIMCAYNIDKSLYSTNATAFGHGVYFACHASFSDRHCSEKSGSTRLMFLVAVMTGSYTQGDPSMHSPPAMETNYGVFDSCVDDVQKPSVFVVFDKEQYYPAYLIEYYSTTASVEGGTMGSLEDQDAPQVEGCSVM